MHKEQCSSLESHFCSSNQLAHAYYVLGVGALLVHNVCLQTNDNHRQSESLLCYFFAQKFRKILDSVMIMIKAKVV